MERAGEEGTFLNLVLVVVGSGGRVVVFSFIILSLLFLLGGIAIF